MAPPLSSDLIHCVFTSLSDFATLLSTILVSKSFHEVFQAHPSSILSSVAKTQVGSDLLPCAVRLAHFDRGEYLASRVSYLQDFPSEKRFSHDVPAITPYVAALAKNDRTATELELLFSIMCVLLSISPRVCADGCLGDRHKDRASGFRSLLSPRESLRFRRAFYRWWLMINLFPIRYLRSAAPAGENTDNEGGGTDGDDDRTTDSEDEDDSDDNGNDTVNNDNDGGDADTDAPNVFLEKSQGLRTEFLREFSDDEVAEMWQIHNFMTYASCYARSAIPDPAIRHRGSFASIYHELYLMDAQIPPDLFIWNGPSAIADIFRDLRSFDEPKIGPVGQFTWDFGHVDLHWPGFFVYLAEKNYDTSTLNVGIHTRDQDMSLILDSKVGDTEECKHFRLPLPSKPLKSFRRRVPYSPSGS